MWQNVQKNSSRNLCLYQQIKQLIISLWSVSVTTWESSGKSLVCGWVYDGWGGGGYQWKMLEVGWGVIKVQVTQIFGFYIFSYFKNMESNRGFHKVFLNFGFRQACINWLQTLAFLVFDGTVFLSNNITWKRGLTSHREVLTGQCIWKYRQVIKILSNIYLFIFKL